MKVIVLYKFIFCVIIIKIAFSLNGLEHWRIELSVEILPENNELRFDKIIQELLSLSYPDFLNYCSKMLSLSLKYSLNY